MEKKITKFDLNAAFKALDEIDIPVSEGLKANVALNESIKPVMKTDCLLEDYYDVNSGADLEQAASERAEEVKAAKLDKIEKIIDLDAKSPEELQPSYVGKTIIQCPQCMTLFYKDPADVVVSEDDPSIVNMAETCQHCGNTTGYTVIGKVGAPDDVPTNEPAVEEVPVEETPVEEAPVEEVPAEETDLTPIEEVPVEETTEELPEVEETEEEVKEESFTAHSGNVLAEQVETALESLNKSEENAPVEKHELSEHDSENLTLNEEVDLEEGKYGQTYRFYVRHKDGSEPHFDQDGLKYSEIKQICAEEAEPDDVIFVSVCAVDEKGNETPLDKYSIDKYPKVSDPVDESLAENIIAEALTEDVDLDKKLKDHNEYIEYLQKMIAQEEEALNNAKNEEVKAAIQRRLDGFKSDLEEALPEAVKTSVAEEELPEPEEVGVDSENVEEAPVEEVKTESLNKSEENAPVEKKHTSEHDSENLTLNEEACVDCDKEDCAEGDCCEESLINKEAEEYVDHITTENRTVNEGAEEAKKLDAFEQEVDITVESVEKPLTEAPLNDPKDFEAPEATATNFKSMINNPVFKQFGEAVEEPVKEDLEANVEIAAEEAINKVEKLNDEAEQELSDVDENGIDEAFSNYFTEVYSNVKDFKLTECSTKDDKLVLEGIITFNSGKTKSTAFEFNRTSIDCGKAIYEGLNKDLATDGKFILEGIHEDGGTKLFTEKLSYSYHIDNTLVEGCIEKKTKLEEGIFDGPSLDKNLETAQKLNGAKYVVRAFKRNEQGNFMPEPSKSAESYGKAEKYAKALSNEKDISYVKVYAATLNGQDFNTGSTSADIIANKDLEIIKLDKGTIKENNINKILSILKNTKKLDKADKKVTDLETTNTEVGSDVSNSVTDETKIDLKDIEAKLAAKYPKNAKTVIAMLKNAGVLTN